MFKDYNQNQKQLLPPDINSKLGEEHLVKLISQAVDTMDLSIIFSEYSELGQRAYHPGMLLKIIIYGYAIGVRSSRKLATACNENLAFM